MRATRWIAVALALATSSARADDDKSGMLTTWTHLVDGKVVATETSRTVQTESGNFYASGEIKWKTGKKVHKRTHVQKSGDRLVRYQRMDGGVKAPGVRIFEWEGQLRLAFINAAGKPVDLGALGTSRLWDGELLHLMAVWGLPKQCRAARQPYFDVQKQAPGEATFSCAGTRRALDGDKKPVELNVFSVTGVPGDAIEVWVDGQGGLVGGKIGNRTMLRAKFALEGQKVATPDDGEGDDEDKKAIKDRGVGE